MTQRTPTSEPNAEVYVPDSSKPIPEVETTPPLGQPESMGEPLPEWSTAIDEWGAAWYFHQYGLGALFCLFGVFVAASLVRYHKSTDNRRKKVPYIVLSLVMLFGWSRGLFLSLDAYHSKQLLPSPVLNLLWAVGQPCMVSAYALVFVVLKNALCLKQEFQKWYTTRNIALTTVPYFAFALAAELTVTFLPRLKGLTFACQVLGATFGFLLSFFYFTVSFLLSKKFKNANARAMRRPRMGNRGRQIRITQCLCVASALGGLSICAMQIYAISDIYGAFSEAQFVSAWPWFVFTTILRLVELYMAIVLYLVAFQRGARSTRIDIDPSVTTASNSGGEKSQPRYRTRSLYRKAFDVTGSLGRDSDV